MAKNTNSLCGGLDPHKTAIYSFFSCSGFLDLGFEMVEGKPFEIRMANEIDPNFRACYRYAREHMRNPIKVSEDFIFENSVEDFILRSGAPKKGKDSVYARFSELLIADRRAGRLVGFIGGPPCPDFSIAGKNLGKDGDVGFLSSRYVKLICQEKPDFFLFENVKGLYSSAKHRAYFEYICNQLKSEYLIDPQLVNSLCYGVAQHRERLIMIGVRKDLLPNVRRGELHRLLNWEGYQSYSKPVLAHKKWPGGRPFSGDGSIPWPTQAPNGDRYDYIKELTVRKCWETFGVEQHPNHQNRTKPRSLVKYSSVPEGNTTGKSYHRLNRFKYAFTAAYGHNEVPLHPWEPRRISVAEALATQSLPPDFSFPVNMGISALFKAVGNGVPFLMAKGLATMIRDLLENCQRGVAR